MTVSIETPEKIGGTIEFRLCDVMTKGRDLHQSCFDKHVLLFTDNRERSHRVKSHESLVNIDVELPVGLTCEHCVLQWTFVQGKNLKNQMQQAHPRSRYKVYIILSKARLFSYVR